MHQPTASLALAGLPTSKSKREQTMTTATAAPAARTILQRFASEHGRRIKRDAQDGTRYVPGTYGSIHDHFDGQHLCAVVMTESAKRWGNRKRTGLAAGMRVTMDGDSEGALLFDPEDPKQAKAALGIVKAYRRRKVSPETRARLAKQSRAYAARMAETS